MLTFDIFKWVADQMASQGRPSAASGNGAANGHAPGTNGHANGQPHANDVLSPHSRESSQSHYDPIPVGGHIQDDALAIHRIKYARDVLASECKAVAAAASGNRNETLNRASFALGTLIPSGLLSRDEIAGALADAARSMAEPLSEYEIGRTIASGLDAGQAKPRDLSGVGSELATILDEQRAYLAAVHANLPGVLGPDQAPPDVEDVQASQGPPAAAGRRPRDIVVRRCTDIGNGERLAHYFGDSVRFMRSWRKWLTWDGMRWKLDDRGFVELLAKRTVRAIYAEAAFVEDERRKDIAKWAMVSENNGRIEAMLKRASVEELIASVPDEFDQDPWALNCANTTVNLKDGSTHAHRRSDNITKMTTTPYIPDAPCPLWEATCELVFAGNADLIRYIQRLCGVILTGTVTEQILPIFYGCGQNGKSTILNTLMKILGDDYAMKAPANFLSSKAHPSHPTELADLHGKRLVVAIESGEGVRIDEVLVKELTGSDPIRARRMHEDFWQFNPTHKILLATNHRPSIRGTDHAIWRRIHLVPFSVVIPEAARIKDMPERLQAEYPGILAWCVRGCLDWQKYGLEPTESIVNATNQYRSDEDAVGRFFEDRCIVVEGATNVKVKASVLYQSYRDWADKGGEHPMTQRKFGQSMNERGFNRSTSNGTWYECIGLRQEEDA